MSRGIKVVSLDLPTSWTMAGKAGDEFTSRMFEAINGMLLDMLAAVARKDYDDRRRSQAQGIVKAKAEGAFKGRPEDVQRNAGIAAGRPCNERGCSATMRPSWRTTMRSA
jgi:DNA invertase Pin-like site-specific DNA recombinase